MGAFPPHGEAGHVTCRKVVGQEAGSLSFITCATPKYVCQRGSAQEPKFLLAADPFSILILYLNFHFFKFRYIFRSQYVGGLRTLNPRLAFSKTSQIKRWVHTSIKRIFLAQTSLKSLPKYGKLF